MRLAGSQAELAEYLLAAYSLDPKRTCMIGDRVDTDIALGHAMGASSLLVLTGVATAEDLLPQLSPDAPCSLGRAQGDEPTLPTHAISHVGRLLELL